MKKYVIFGAGKYAERAIRIIGEENVEFLLDNNKVKWGTKLCNIKIGSLSENMGILPQYTIIIAVSLKYQAEIINQLEALGINNYKTFRQMQMILTKVKIDNRTNYINVYQKSIIWLEKNSIKGDAIAICSDNFSAYPEVTGYFIPTLLRWGYRDLAISYANWLCKVQKENGAWYGCDKTNTYIF